MFYVILFLLWLPSVKSVQIWQINENQKDLTTYGDMILTPSQRQRYAHKDSSVRHLFIKETTVNRWQNNTIPFVVSSKYSKQNAEIILEALKSFEEKTCFQFKPRVSEKDYLFIDALDGCYSYVGKTGGRQLLSLSEDCLADYIIWHEVMHAIGIEHEHQRPDRDKYIRVVYENVDMRQIANFDKLAENGVEYTDKYDYQSIMHYDGFAFGKVMHGQRLVTMLPLARNVRLDDNMKLSFLDIKKLNRIGKCDSEKEQSNELCADKDNSCNSMKNRGLCEMSFYRSTMLKLCPHSCGFCSPPARLHKTTCEDRDVNCESYARNGFCSEKFYKTIHEVKCAKTCGYC
ncbi:unnamed protein product [Auanema sp. JU1783]|nr:unnamed protein product [Auanema sp. JU1783]